MKKIYLIISIVFMIAPILNGEEINVYFNKTIDSSGFSHNVADGEVALDSLLCSYIHRAEYSIDCCVYSMNDWDIRDSLIAAHLRGVNVRFITDDENVYDEIDSLKNAGIPVITDSFPYGYSGQYNMHNKFFIFDYRDSTSTDDDWVFTGSYNPTYWWGTVANAQNVLTIKDSEVARAYTGEFEEMWGSKNNTPSRTNSRFSYQKSNNTEHSFFVGGIEVDIYFSPTDNVESEIINKINTCNHEINFSIFYFSNQNISNAIKSVWNGKSTSDSSNVRGVFDTGSWLGNSDSEARDMAGIAGSGNPWNPPLDTNSVIVRDNVSEDGLLHHKYLIVDGTHPSSHPCVITGSTNWSYWGFSNNDENSVIITSVGITDEYIQEWRSRYMEAGGIPAGADSEEKSLVKNLEVSRKIITPGNNLNLTLKDKNCRGEILLCNSLGQIVRKIGIPESRTSTPELVIKTEGLKSGYYFLRTRSKKSEPIKILILK